MQYFHKYITSMNIYTKLKQLKLSHVHKGIKDPTSLVFVLSSRNHKECEFWISFKKFSSKVHFAEL